LFRHFYIIYNFVFSKLSPEAAGLRAGNPASNVGGSLDAAGPMYFGVKI
jgi:hypothetical protein